MPRTMSEAFDEAYSRPDARPLSDKQITALDALLSMVESVNIVTAGADLRLADGETYAVSPNLCAACGAASDQDCPHKAIARTAVEYARELNDQDYHDYAHEKAERYAIMGGVG